MRVRSRGGGGRKPGAAPCLPAQPWFGKLVQTWDLRVSRQLSNPEPGRLWDGEPRAAPECAPQPRGAGRLGAAARVSSLLPSPNGGGEGWGGRGAHPPPARGALPAPNALLSPPPRPHCRQRLSSSGGASPTAPAPLPLLRRGSAPARRGPAGGPAHTWWGAHREPLQRPAPAPSSALESGSPGAGGRRRRHRRRHPPPSAPSSSASLLPPLPPPPRAPHRPLFMARGREPGAARPAQSVLRGRARDWARGREGPRGAGPGARTQRAAAPGAGGEQQPQAPEPRRAPARPPGDPSPERRRRRL